MMERKLRTRIMSLILVVVMVVSLLPQAFAATIPTKNQTQYNVTELDPIITGMINKPQADGVAAMTGGQFVWDTEGKRDSWRYFNGIMMDAFLAMYAEDNTRTDALNLVKQFYQANVQTSGTPLNYKVGELDSVVTARALFDLIQLDSANADKYKAAINYVYGQLEAQTTYADCGGNYLHKQNADGTPTESWTAFPIGLDGVYMAEPFLMDYAIALQGGVIAAAETLDVASDTTAAEEELEAAPEEEPEAAPEEELDVVVGELEEELDVVVDEPEEELLVADEISAPTTAAAAPELDVEADAADATATTYMTIAESVFKRFDWIANNMKMANGIYAHGWNPSTETVADYGNGVSWLRGVGWYAVAQAEVIDQMKTLAAGATAEEKVVLNGYISTMSAQLASFFDGMMKYQDSETGMWYNVVDAAASDINKLETSGTAMMAYAMMLAYNTGIVNDAKYGEAGLMAFNGIMENKVVDGQVTDILKSSGVCTTADAYCQGGNHVYEANEGKGVAPLIMAALSANDTAAKLNAVQGINVSGPEGINEVTEGGTLQLEVTLADDTLAAIGSNYTTTFTSSNTSIATVSETGLVTGLAQGDVTITVDIKPVNTSATTGIIGSSANKSAVKSSGSVYRQQLDLSVIASLGAPSDPDTNQYIYVQDTDGIDVGAEYILIGTHYPKILSYDTNTAASDAGYGIDATASVDAYGVLTITPAFTTENQVLFVGTYTANGVFTDGTRNLRLEKLFEDASASPASKVQFKLQSDGSYQVLNAAGTRQLQDPNGSAIKATGYNEGGTVHTFNLYKKTPTSATADPVVTVTGSYTVVTAGAAGSSNIALAVTAYGTETTNYTATYALVDAPAGITIDAATGAITTTADAAAGEYTVSVTVTAVNGKTLATPVRQNVTLSVEASRAVPDYSIELSHSQLSLVQGNSTDVTVVVKDKNGNVIPNDQVTINWTTGDSTKATVSGQADGTGRITATDTGLNAVTITATLASVNGTAVTDISSSVVVTVKKRYNTNIEFPEPGAVAVTKTATDDHFYNDGMTDLELGIFGKSVSTGVNIVLVVDVSNSMGWAPTDSVYVYPEGATDQDKLPTMANGSIDETGNMTNTQVTQNKLYAAMEAAKSFADILFADGNPNQNSLSYVTFAGYDADNFNGTSTNIDSVTTVFQDIRDVSRLDEMKAAFDATRMYGIPKTDSTTGSVNYTLQLPKYENGAWTTVSGINRGNTNYDYAFAQANKVTDAIANSANTAEEQARPTYVLFMTDGVASHFDAVRGNGGQKDYIPGTTTEYPIADITGWETRIQQGNQFAQALETSVNGCTAPWIIGVGFDLKNGGFGTFNPSVETVMASMRNLINGGDAANGRTVTALNVETVDQLKYAFVQIANSLRYAGSNASVEDKIGANFDVVMEEGSTITVSTSPVYTDPVTGDYGPDPDKANRTPVETLTFHKDAVSGAITVESSATTDASYVETDTTITITAKSFTYTKDKATSEEIFNWTVGNISDDVIILNYQLKINGFDEGTVQAGTYPTNEYATLTYKDINEQQATKPFPEPQLPWQSATTQLQFYLVDKDTGKPVNSAGDVLDFGHRIIVHTAAPHSFTLGAAETCRPSAVLPNGYALFNTDTFVPDTDVELSYTVTAIHPDSTSTETGSWTTNDVKYIDGVEANGVTTKLVQGGDSNKHVNTVIAVGVYRTTTVNVGTALNPDTWVLDYGLPTCESVLANDADRITLPDGNIVTAKEVVGFTRHAANTNYTQSFSTAGATTAIGAYGNFSIDGGKVKYTMNKMIAGPEVIDVVVKVEVANTENTVLVTYNMLQTLTIVPATQMVYEADFAGIKTSDAWREFSDTDQTITQDSGVVTDGVIDLYGFDSHYGSQPTTCTVYGFFNYTGNNTPVAEFTFTGTGFDLISKTGVNEGCIRVDIYNASNQRVKKITCLNKSESNWELYNVPVVSVNDLAYGTYTVKITVYSAYTDTTYPSLSYGDQFVFDAVRIFDPAVGNADCEAVYAKHNEQNPVVYEVRDILLNPDAAAGTGYKTGVGYVDLTRLLSGTDVSDPSVVNKFATLDQYAKVGPNNEVYLDPGQGIVFAVDGYQPGMKITVGAKYIARAGAQEGVASTLLCSCNDAGIFVSSGTVQNYEVTGYAGGVITITAGDGAVSITDIKISGAGASTAKILVNNEVLAAAASIREEYQASQEPQPMIDVLTARAETKTVKLFSRSVFTVTTGADVESLKVTNKFGNQVKFSAEAELNADGQKVWTVSVPMTLLGKQTYTFTGVGADGETGGSQSAIVYVKLF